MIDLIAENLTNTRVLAMVFAAIAAVATVLTLCKRYCRDGPL